MSVDELNRESERYLQRNANTMLPEEHFRARIKQFARELERVQAPLPCESRQFLPTQDQGVGDGTQGR
jgi:hypothetical protein